MSLTICFSGYGNKKGNIMNYSLSSSRKVGNYIQKIITTYNNAPPSTSADILTKLKEWHTTTGNILIHPGVVTEEIIYTGYTEAQSDENTNPGTLADVLITVACADNQVPAMTNFSIKNIALNDLRTSIFDKFGALTGVQTTSSNIILTSILINLH